MSSVLPILLGLAAVHLLAVASPGPTMAVVMSNALGGERRAALFVAAGVLCATCVWASLAAAGLGAVLKGSPLAYRALQYAGAAYLVYLGAQILFVTLRARGRMAANDNARGAAMPADTAPTSDLSKMFFPRRAATDHPNDLSAWRTGFITNITNPNTIAYFAALFGVLIPADASRALFWSAVVTVLTISTLWWIGVVSLFSIPAVRRVYERIRPVADVAMGLMLVGLGVRIAVGG